MNFNCKNCGGNMVFSPKNQVMYCPFCEGTDCEEKKGDDSLTVCSSCGAELSVKEFESSSKCPYCGNYLIFDKRVSDEYKPDSVIPFKISREMAIEALEEKFGKRLFLPLDFFSEKALVNLKGCYVPFFLYDYEAMGEFEGTCTSVKTWRSGYYDYKETSYYHVSRKMQASFDNVPADASLTMPDSTMDLMEPYNYAELMNFDPKYLSGFFGEIYNAPKEEFEERAKKKTKESAQRILRDSIKNYSTVSADVENVSLNPGKTDYSLFPVWEYLYTYKGKLYSNYINGQTGKIVGNTPTSVAKVIIYGLAAGGMLLGAIEMILKMLEVLF